MELNVQVVSPLQNYQAGVQKWRFWSALLQKAGVEGQICFKRLSKVCLSDYVGVREEMKERDAVKTEADNNKETEKTPTECFFQDDCKCNGL